MPTQANDSASSQFPDLSYPSKLVEIRNVPKRIESPDELIGEIMEEVGNVEFKGLLFQTASKDSRIPTCVRLFDRLDDNFS